MSDSMTGEDLKVLRVPEVLPILPLFNMIVFPKMMLPLEVFGEQSIALVDEAMAQDRMIGLVLTKSPPQEMKYSPDDFYPIGTAAVILKMAKGMEKKAQLLVQGISRFLIREFVEGKSYLQARIETLNDVEIKDIEVEALMANLVSLFDRVVKLTPFLPQEFGAMAKTITEPGVLADLICSIINVTPEEKQSVLETLDVKERLRLVTKLVNHQVEILELGNKIQSEIKSDMDRAQREYFLRQQLKAIKKELGESDETRVEIEEYREKLAQKNLPEEVRKEAERELGRLEKMHPSSAEYTVSSTYLDWILALPWNEGTKDNLDIKKARKILDEDHYGLEKPKKRIIEYLAVRKLKPDSKGPILCFVGPPGTGKTSLGQSIARALERKFVRIALGGVRDEAEIRGHRRTYIGALPGRIIQGIRRAESNNPVFMLDEIDKLGADFRGDPSSALLEVLDPAQNYAFVDHYLDLPFDLSHVMFITTANVLDTIPPPLRDRLEVIELVSYTQDEKLNIARRYLIPRQIAENGLTPEQISFTKGAINLIISGYTREAGVRNLEREIASICRAVACQVAEGKTTRTVVGVKDVPKYLGPVRVIPEVVARTGKPGIAVGLAWTPAGGEILFIEATAMPGKKGLTLTGQLGEVMKESAMAALSFIRANAEVLDINRDFYENTDIHIHVPSGAIPKDGPSAGVTILTALTSLLTGRPVKKDLAMTGEITLRGLVLPVGGIKEKVLAAHRAGIRTVLLPKWNKKDLEEIPPHVRKEMEFKFVEDMMEVLRTALEKD
ncbi:MAG TPA: endopeptidase La [Syntrophales bacterium]|nr:endopeptidase La [Syntrophales bacterium]HOL59285.1 endopeptidase La [Syntrophales bacterium]HPO35335.1 endopeptidase La [Syntrophales bacterium]